MSRSTRFLGGITPATDTILRPFEVEYEIKNPGIATKACQSTEMAKGMAAVRIARKLFLSNADDEPYRPLYIVLAQA
jgi:hypothetical protein